MIGKRYLLYEEVGQGGMGTVYRASDRLTGQIVALKRVTARPQRLEFASRNESTDFRIALAHEFKTLASLRHPNIISVLDYGFDDERVPYFTMDYLEQPQTIVEAAAGKSQSQQLDLLMQIFQALAYLHRRGIIHRDLKPANILVVGDTVKVVDFGLALTHQSEEDETVGTLAYMAPEVLMGQVATVESDLYAVGMIAYEIFAGRHPFPNTPDLIDYVLYVEPDVSMLDVSSAVREVISRLIAKKPYDRYSSAVEIIAAYNEATKREIPYETPLTRESFLQAAQFVGRETEMAQLNAAFAEAIAGRGSAWLIAGESGVGKSRLLDELRTQALVQGAMVLRGQAKAEGASAYQTWREIARWLALTTPLSDLEASVLKALVPDIGTLLDRAVPDAIEIAPQAAQERLFGVFEQVLKRQTKPLVIMLEDLHWARESLDLLLRFVRLAPKLPLLLLGSYRDDERPNLPSQLPGMNVLKLRRFDAYETATLCASMLGDAGYRQDVVELVQREAEGNAFFLIEVVRALAEEAGQLDRIATMTLPEHVVAGGINKIVQRRLSRVPPAAYPLLQAAALIGRRIDLQLLQRIYLDANLTDWLIACAEAATVEVQNEVWRFAHDKLREGLIESIELDAKRLLHRQIAQAIEAVYGEDKTQLASLAHHWGEAQDRAKEAHYAGLAGELALEEGRNRVAIEYLERALELETDQGLRRAHLEQQLSEAYHGVGELIRAKQHSETALRLLGYPMSQAAGSLAGRLLVQLTRQGLHRRFPSRFIGRADGQREVLLEAARAYQRLSVINYMQNDTLSTLLATVYSLNLSERAGVSPELAHSYANFGLAIGLVPMHGAAERYLQRALETCEQAQQGLQWSMLICGLYHLGVGKLDIAFEELCRSKEMAEREGNVLAAEEAESIFPMYYFHRGEFAQGQEVSWNLAMRAREIGAMHNYGSALVSHAANRLRQGSAPMEEVLDLLEVVLSQTSDQGYKIVGYATMALHHLRRGMPEKALAEAEKVGQFIFKAPATSYYSLVGYIFVAETYLMLWEAGNTAQAENARRACKALRACASLFPLVEASALRYDGWRLWLEGKHSAAIKAWQKSIAGAKRLGLPYAEARTHYEIGRHLDSSHPDRAAHLQAAQALFTRLDAQYDLAHFDG